MNLEGQMLVMVSDGRRLHCYWCDTETWHDYTAYKDVKNYVCQTCGFKRAVEPKHMVEMKEEV